MKILLDCVVTAFDPSKCSTNIQYLTFVKRTLSERPDVFFYWLIPDWITDEVLHKVYPQHPNVAYFRVPQHRDRTKEYLTLSKALDDAVAFNGKLWDFDVLLTMRSGLVSILRMLATCPKAAKNTWLRQFWLIEAMVLMEFKPTVLTFAPQVQDYFTLTGYLASDYVFLTSQNDRLPILQRARELLPPSKARELSDKITPVGYAQFSTTKLRDPATWPDPKNGKPLCIAHAGRMEKANRIKEINDVMVKQFITKGANVELLVCTVSESIQVFDQSVIEIKQASRDEFWNLCNTKMHVIIKMSEEGGSSLALLEPMMMGVPAIVGPRKATEKALGKDYPFIVNNETEAYALVQMFYEDYPAMYAKWAAWHQGPFQEIVQARFADASVYAMLDAALDGYADVHTRYREEYPNRKNKKFALEILEHIGDAKEFVVADVIREMVAAQKVDPTQAAKLQDGDRDRRGLIWSNDLNELRKVLQVFHGWTDASTTVGHLKRSS